MTDMPGEPPPWVTQRTLWRLAMCVVRDHRRQAERCVRCRLAWPCDSRRLAERGLAEAGRVRGRHSGRNPAYLDWLRQYARREDRP